MGLEVYKESDFCPPRPDPEGYTKIEDGWFQKILITNCLEVPRYYRMFRGPCRQVEMIRWIQWVRRTYLSNKEDYEQKLFKFQKEPGFLSNVTAPDFES